MGRDATKAERAVSETRRNGMNAFTTAFLMLLFSTSYICREIIVSAELLVDDVLHFLQ